MKRLVFFVTIILLLVSDSVGATSYKQIQAGADRPDIKQGVYGVR